jgi:glycosyltransferase involved in cell wall biosynthesis
MWRRLNQMTYRRRERLSRYVFLPAQASRQGDKETRRNYCAAGLLGSHSPCLPLLFHLMRRILHIIDSLDPHGPASQLGIVAQGLEQEGFQVQIAALDAGHDTVQEKICIPVHRIGRRWSLDLLALLRLGRLIRRLEPDVVHTWDLNSAIYASAAMARVPRSWRYRVRAWGLLPRETPVVMGLYRIEPWKPAWQRQLATRLASLADRLVANSPIVRNWYAARGMPSDKLTIIPPGVSAARGSDVSRHELLSELKLPSDARLIGVIGRLAPENRVKDLIWAADLLRVLHNNLRLLVIGDGPLRTQLEEYAGLASDLDHIQFLGARSDSWRIVPHLDVLWNASENVGPSTAILEAMASGVPVVASDTPANRELVVENETGYLIALGTRSGRADRARHTDRIFSNPDLAARLSRAAHERAADRFDAQRALSKYWELYSRIGN